MDMTDDRKVHWVSASQKIGYRYERPRRIGMKVYTTNMISPLTHIRQIEKYNAIDIPIIISEYGAGNTTKSPRTFTETPTIYSPEMTAIFSGGCVYELWQGPNSYGLAQFEPNAATHDRRNTSQAGKFAEKRESDLGTLSLFEDFMNYKAQLAALPQMPTSANGYPAEQQKMGEAQSSTSREFNIEGSVPEACVDWLAIEEGLRSQD